MMFSVTPETLFRRYLRSGSPADLAEVFDHVAPELLRMSRHLARDEAEAEDLVQVVFLAAIETRTQFGAKGKLTSWLVSILVNELRQIRRRERRMAGSAVSAQSVEGSAGPLDIAHATEVRLEVRSAVDGLPEPYREVINGLLMRHEEAREIADRLGRSRDTVRSQIRRGLMMLRRSLPMGLATGVAVTVTPVRGLASIRRVVISKAQVEPLVVAGLLSAKTLFVLSLLLALVAGLFARWVPSIKSECLSRIIPFGSTSLERAISDFTAHYNSERPHQGLGNELINGEKDSGSGEVIVSERLGGLLKHYHRSAA